MADKNKEKEATPEDLVDRVYKEVEKTYGEGLLVAGSDLITQDKMIIPAWPSLDIISSGGIMEGSVVGFTGPEKGGKTCAALTIAANAQKPEYGSRPVFFGDVEHRMTSMHLRGIKGLKTEKPHFNWIKSVKGRILTAEEHLDIYTKVLKTVPGAVLIIDSISQLCDEKEMTEGMGYQSRGGGAKLFSQFLRIIKDYVPVNDCIVIGITHLISNTSGFGSPFQERAANNWKYSCDYRFRIKTAKDEFAGGRPIGKTVTWVCNCSKLGPPGMTIDSFLRYGVGFDKLTDCIKMGTAAGLIRKAGAWYNLDFVSKLLPNGEAVPKAQGEEKLYQLLNQNPQWVDLLEKEVLEFTGSLGSVSNEV